MEERTRAFEVSSSCRDAQRRRETERSEQLDVRTETSAEMIGTGLVFLVLTAAVSPARSQGIELTSKGAELSCSGGNDGAVSWKKGTEDMKDKNIKLIVSAEHEMVKGEFSCEYKHGDGQSVPTTVRDLFYLNAKVCENCYELSSFMAAAVILGDLLITGAVILSVYVCVSKNTGSTQQKASKPRAQSAPPVPNPDYQVLNQRTRTTDVYSALK